MGSFNFDNRKMVFDSYLLPQMPNHTKSILDYNVVIKNLKPEATYFVPAETGECPEVDITYRVWPINSRLSLTQEVRTLAKVTQPKYSTSRVILHEPRL